jgi:formylglycine-generating enzyme required for sulfatase activity
MIDAPDFRRMLLLAFVSLRCAAPPAPGTSPQTQPPPPDPAAPAPAQASAPAAVASQAPAQAASADAAAPPDVPSDMLPVPGGTFTMGADDEGEMDERPAHRVTVAPFLLDKTEVTNAAYLECVKAGACEMYSSLADSRLTNGQTDVFHRPDHPVVGVSWFDAKKYCAFRAKRLPREAEWERAARGDDQRRYVWGNDEPDPKKHGVFQNAATTAPVGSFPAGKGAYGHLDLAGNVWEWMEDEYDPYAYSRKTAAQGIPGSCNEILAAQDELRRDGKQGFTGSNPIPTECEHVLRGGAYNYLGKKLRNSNRVHHPARFKIAVAGFRCAR